jgi:hypothetical protein
MSSLTIICRIYGRVKRGQIILRPIATASGRVGPQQSFRLSPTTLCDNHGHSKKVYEILEDLEISHVRPSITNAPYYTNHVWTTPGDYPVTFTAFNVDNPTGVSTNILMHIDPIFVPVLGPVTLVTNAIQFDFVAQPGPDYLIEVVTNLAPPVSWFPIQGFSAPNGGVIHYADPVNRPARF